MIVIKRKDAAVLGLIHYFTGKPCAHGHIDERFVKSKKCVSCERDWQTAWRNKNRALFRKLCVDGARRYRERDPERAKLIWQKWSALNPEKRRASVAAWRKRNPEKHAATQASRRAKQDLSVLSEQERIAIKNIYKDRAKISTATGIFHHVDHVVPLAKGGRHHPSNLQIITAKENQAKGAK